jgi:DNA repair protein RadD
MFTPRPYQEYAIQSIFDYFNGGGTGNPVIVAPTGTGKALILAEFIKRTLMSWPDQRIMMLTHVKELIAQNMQTLLRQWPAAPAGTYSAGLKRKEHNQQITFAGIASVAKKPELFGCQDIITIDECHLVSEKADAMYSAFLNALKEVNPHIKVVGLTATPYRLKNGHLTEGTIFTDVCCDMTTPEAYCYFVENGYMAALITKRTNMEIDTSNVPIRGGDFAKKQLQEAVNKTELTRAAVEEMIELGKNRHSWIVFATGIDHAENIARMLNRRGIKSTAIHSKLKPAERDERINDFKSGVYRAVVNMGIMTTGFDHPPIDMVGFLRPTQSTSLWLQALGRATRPFDGDGIFPAKENALVLDFAGNTRRLGPIDDPVIPKRARKGKGGTAPVKTCEKCMFYNHATAKFCCQCGHEFKMVNKLYTTSDTTAVMRLKKKTKKEKKKEPIIEIFSVDHAVFVRHAKIGKPVSLKVTYHCGLRQFSEWICLEHDGWPLRRARSWWGKMSATPVPMSVDEALKLTNDIDVPKAIKVDVSKKYPSILEYLRD